MIGAIPRSERIRNRRQSIRILEAAVHQHSAASREGMLERLFTFWFKGFVYNQIWEDPRVDALALELDATSRLLTISSGGCNVLNYLVHAPARIIAVDLNANHMALTRLKLTAARRLSHEDFFEFFGVSRGPHLVELYEQQIRPHLDEETRRFWDGRTFSGGGLKRRIRLFEHGFYDNTRLGTFIRASHAFSRLVGQDTRRFLKSTCLAEQEAFYRDVVEPFFEHELIQFLGRHAAALFSLGIPPRQHAVLMEETDGSMTDMFKERMRKLICDFPLHDNYFAWQACGRCYDVSERRGIPDYLKEAHFESVKTGADRVETRIATLDDVLRSQKPGSLDGFVLLDSQDWMSDEAVAGLWDAIARAGAPGARIIFGTAGRQSPIEAALAPDQLKRFVYHPTLSEDLHRQDRSAIYGMFHVYELIA